MILNDKLIIWDCDGVLVDSELLGARAFAEIIRTYGCEIDERVVLDELKGGNIHVSLDYVSDITGEKDYEMLERRFRQRSFELFETELRAVEGVEDMVIQLSDFRCVASNGPRIKIMKNLEITGLIKYFANQHIFSGHDIDAFKPEPDLFLYAAENMGFDPQDCIVIEDSLQGAEAADRAGMKCFLYGGNTDTKATYTTFQAMSELSGLVLGLQSAQVARL